MTAAGRPLLSIVIPALNEEDAIGATVGRCLEARSRIAEEAGLSGVEVLVVSDGSSDRTEEIALGYPDVTVLTFERNRGYGAAIKTGWEHARGELLGFLDADGTCDPAVFVGLCRAVRNGADVALGSRMGQDSQMPAVRILGNKLFAWMLGLLSRRVVQDTASGMRVVRRSALPDLYPLPDGLHFTPAMSARALLEEKLTLVEVPMPYAERVGRSKLSVVRDGVRFLRRDRARGRVLPPRPPAAGGRGRAGPGGSGGGPVAGRVLRASLAARGVDDLQGPRELALRERRGRPRLHCDRGGAHLRRRVRPSRDGTRPHRPADGLGPFSPVARLIALPLALLAMLVAWPGIEQYAATGRVEMHWSRAILASLLLTVGATIVTSTFLLGLMDLISTQRGGGAGVRAPDRLRPARGDAS